MFKTVLIKIFLPGWILPVVLFVASPAGAWGPQGHAIVAAIAQERLNPATLEILRMDFNINRLADVANWADQIKSQRTETRPWHYTNIPEGETLYVRRRDCPTGDCVTEKIREFASLLESRSRSRHERREALKFLIHFVADIHQPLHLGNKTDRGGNEIAVRVGDERTNLHAVWDHDLIHLDGKSLVEYAAGLAGEISPAQAREWTGSGVVAWSQESRKLALESGYPIDRDDDGRLTGRYLKKAEGIVVQQLKKAGVRLAYRLNQIIK